MSGERPFKLNDMKYIASQKVYYYIDPFNLEEGTEHMELTDSDTFAKLKEWAERSDPTIYYRSPAIMITCIVEPKEQTT